METTTITSYINSYLAEALTQGKTPGPDAETIEGGNTPWQVSQPSLVPWTHPTWALP